MAIALEGTAAADMPGVPPTRRPSSQGQGPAITVADNSFIAPPTMVQALERTAEREGIPYQIKTPSYGSTDAGAIHQSRGGVLTGVISVPCRYIHSPFSTCRLSDFDHTWQLLTAFCKRAPGVGK
jgi:endoglucanase